MLAVERIPSGDSFVVSPHRGSLLAAHVASDDVSRGPNVRVIGPHLLVHTHEPLVVDGLPDGRVRLA